MTGERQHERHREFGDADTVGTRRVHDDDATSARGWYVNVIDASAGACDGTQLGCGVDQCRRHTRRAANHDGVGVCDVGGELLRGAARSCVYFPAFVAEEIDCGSREVICDKDLHGFEKSIISGCGRVRARHTRNVRTTMVQTAKTFRIICNDRVYRRCFQQAFQQKL